MKAITLTLATVLLATFVEARPEYYLQCSKKEMGIRWPSYINSGEYYVCQHEKGMLMKLSCTPGQLFTFVLQMCTSPNKFIPPPPLDDLPISSAFQTSSHNRPQHNLNGAIDISSLPRPYSPTDPKPSMNFPQWQNLPHLPNGPHPPTVDHPIDVLVPPSVNEHQPPNQVLPVPPSSSVVQPQPPTIAKPPSNGSSGVPQPPAKPFVPLPPTPAPTPTLIKVTPSVPVKGGVPPMPPTSQKKKMPQVPVKVKQN